MLVAVVLITGMSGTGKSAALAELARRRHRVVDTDYREWTEEVPSADGGRAERLWREDWINSLLSGHDDGALFVSGCVPNQGKFYPRFDAVVLLSAPADVILARVAARETNDYGKTAAQRELIAEDLANVEPLLRAGATAEIDTQAPLEDVVDALERIAGSVGRLRIELTLGDITQVEADAIVNAANSSLLGGGGVDGAIHRAGGSAILEESRRLGGCETGDAKATTAGDLAARVVIHAVGPVWQGGKQGEDELLASAHRRSLEVASEVGARTVAFPAISTGVYRFPVDRAARIAIGTTADYLAGNPELERVTFVLFSDDHLRAFERALEELTPP